MLRFIFITFSEKKGRSIKSKGVSKTKWHVFEWIQII